LEEWIARTAEFLIPVNEKFENFPASRQANVEMMVLALRPPLKLSQNNRLQQH
jgi:hypothetical protein